MLPPTAVHNSSIYGDCQNQSAMCHGSGVKVDSDYSGGFLPQTPWIVEFDPKRDSIPIFGSLLHRFTTTYQLQKGHFYLNISLKMACFKAPGSW